MTQFVTRIAPATKRKVVKMYREGTKVRDIVDETGVSRSSVYWVLKEQGVQVRQKSGPKPKSQVGSDSDAADDGALLAVISAQRATIERQAEEIGRLRAKLGGRRP